MEMISLDRIHVKNPYLRLDTDIEKLAQSIKTVGLIHPLVINNDDYLIAGGRRYSALKFLGVNEVPVHRIDKDAKEQELISIDENLVRLDLTKVEMEHALRRAKDLYEEINPEAPKVDLDADDKLIEKEMEAHTEGPKSFLAMAAEKTGLSPKVIKAAIARDERSSDTVKKARSMGIVSASQVGEMIKLNQDDQEELLPHVQGKTVKEIRSIVKEARQGGLKQALQTAMQRQSVPREVKLLKDQVKKTNKLLAKMLLEELLYAGEDQGMVVRSLNELKHNIEAVLSHYEDDSSYRSVDEQPVGQYRRMTKRN